MTPELAKKLLYGMKRIRAVEEGIAARYSEQEMRCPVHLSIGQEGIAGFGLALRPDDLAVSGHRAHAHYLAKGGNLRAMLAEIYGKAAGCAGGKGGSMHLIDEAAGFMGSTAIVGGTIPVGVGLGFGLKQKQSDSISCVFLGDAAIETGVFFESANFATVRKLPVVFVCENNLYSVYSPLKVRQPLGRKIHEMVRAMGLTTCCIDGNDVETVYDTAVQMIAATRKSGTPAFLELMTYRWREHCGPNYDNDIGYRTQQEFEEWKQKDPIPRFEKKLLEAHILLARDIQEIHEAIAKEVNEAFTYAKTTPFPDVAMASESLYAP